MNFYDLTLAEASLFENYKSKGYDDLLTALRLADEKIISDIYKTKGEWTRKNLSSVKRSINTEIGNAYGGLFESMQDESVETAQIVLGASLGKIGADLPKAVIDDLIGSKRLIRMSEESVYEFKELFGLTSNNHARQLRVLISSGVAQGKTVNQIIRDYNIKSDKLSKGQLKSNIFTVIANSRDEGRYVAYKQLEDEGIIEAYLYDATLDSSTTIYCREHDQRKYFDKIENIQSEIKVHANCRSIFRPIPLLDQEGSTRASQIGETEELPYSQWYAKQSDSFKKSTLTNRRYNAYLKGNFKVSGLSDLNKKVPIETIRKELMSKSKGLPTPSINLDVNKKLSKSQLESITKMDDLEAITQFNKTEHAGVFKPDGTKVFAKKGGKKSVNFSGVESLYMQDNILTHNHPDGFTFSPEDLYMAVTTNLKEIRAVGSNYIHRLVRPEKGWESVVSVPSSMLKKAREKSRWADYTEDGKHGAIKEIAEAYNLNYTREPI